MCPVTNAQISNFPLTEDPISEGDNWISGKTIGLDWANVATYSFTSPTWGFPLARKHGTLKIDLVSELTRRPCT